MLNRSVIRVQRPRVEYLVIGGYAVRKPSQPRGTKDLDVFIGSDPDKSHRVFQALI